MSLLPISIFICVLASLSLRIWAELVVPGQPELARYALQDFRDAIYYPTMAWLEGVNPYDSRTYMKTYPAGQVFPPYGPALFLLHLPFAMFPLRTAALLYAAMSMALTAFLSSLALRVAGIRVGLGAVAMLTVSILLSRPGQLNLFLGQSTLPLALATGFVLAYPASNGILAGAAFGLTAVKPTFAVPLGILLLAQGRWRTLLIGGALAAVATILPMTTLVVRAGGVNEFLTSVLGSYTAWGEKFPNALPTTIFRIDVLNLIAKLNAGNSLPLLPLVASASTLALGSITLYRLRSLMQSPLGRDVSLTVASLTILVCIYHQVYDALFLVVPLLVWARRIWIGAPDRWAVLVFVAMMIPMLNYGASWDLVALLGVERWPAHTLVALNSLALVTALLGSVVLAERIRVQAKERLDRALAGRLSAVV